MNTFAGYEIQELFDPVQTHVTKGVAIAQVPQVKADLKQAGATRFRVVKNEYGSAAVCFKIKSK
jgi:hypothetical protein